MSLLSLNDRRFKLSEGYCYYFRLKAEIEKIKLEYEESTSHEQQKYTSEIKVSFCYLQSLIFPLLRQVVQSLHIFR